jgi:hypothetical protein
MRQREAAPTHKHHTQRQQQQQQRRQYRWGASWEEDWQHEELSSVWGVEDSIGKDDDEPHSAWYKKQLQQQQQQSECRVLQERGQSGAGEVIGGDVAYAAASVALSAWWRGHLMQQQQQKQKDRSTAAAAVALPDLVRPEGLSDADWSLVKAVAEEQEAILQQQQQQQQQDGSGGDGGQQCMLGEGSDALDGPRVAAGGGGAFGGLGFVVREQDGISRVCPVVEGMGQGSVEASREEEDGVHHLYGEGEDEGMVEGHVSWLSSVQVAKAVSGVLGGSWDHPVVLHSMYTFDESILHG